MRTTPKQQPGVVGSIKQPERIQLSYLAWRILTSGGDHAELCLEKAEDAAKGAE